MGIFDNELRDVISELEHSLASIHDELDEMINECFFKYGKSLVKDFSIFNGFRKYKWVSDSYINKKRNAIRETSFDELYVLGDFYELLGGEFWKPEHTPLIW